MFYVLDTIVDENSLSYPVLKNLRDVEELSKVDLPRGENIGLKYQMEKHASLFDF